MLSRMSRMQTWRRMASQPRHICRRALASSAINSDSAQLDMAANHQHFRESPREHPLKTARVTPHIDPELNCVAGDHSKRLQNYIWDDESLNKALGTHDYAHQPETFSDKVAHTFMHSFLYKGFNFITQYKADNPTARSIEWRLVILESVAGVPGFVAAGFRHFYSIRTLQRDHGWICTLLEEAENERMHLLTCLQMFEASRTTRVLCVAAQWTMAPMLTLTYMFNPRMVHRFVGYLEQTACETYHNIIVKVETPGTHLHKAWADLPAPPIAIGYWKLKHDAKWLDALKCMYADETHHRDVNHTFASMKTDDPNPFVAEMNGDASLAWYRKQQERLQQSK